MRGDTLKSKISYPYQSSFRKDKSESEIKKTKINKNC